MGALPSRESTEDPGNVLICNCGNHIVLHVPLTPHYFPSEDSLAFQQLFRARNDQSALYGFDVRSLNRFLPGPAAEAFRAAQDEDWGPEADEADPSIHYYDMEQQEGFAPDENDGDDADDDDDRGKGTRRRHLRTSLETAEKLYEALLSAPTSHGHFVDTNREMCDIYQREVAWRQKGLPDDGAPGNVVAPAFPFLYPLADAIAVKLTPSEEKATRRAHRRRMRASRGEGYRSNASSRAASSSASSASSRSSRSSSFSSASAHSLRSTHASEKEATIRSRDATTSSGKAKETRRAVQDRLPPGMRARRRYRFESDPALRDGRVHLVEEDGVLYHFAQNPVFSEDTEDTDAALGTGYVIEPCPHDIVRGSAPGLAESASTGGNAEKRYIGVCTACGVAVTRDLAHRQLVRYPSWSVPPLTDSPTAGATPITSAGCGITSRYLIPISPVRIVGVHGLLPATSRGTPWLRGTDQWPASVDAQLEALPAERRPPVMRLCRFIDGSVGEKILNRAALVSLIAYRDMCLRAGLPDALVRPLWSLCVMSNIPYLQMVRETFFRVRAAVAEVEDDDELLRNWIEQVDCENNFMNFINVNLNMVKGDDGSGAGGTDPARMVPVLGKSTAAEAHQHATDTSPRGGKGGSPGDPKPLPRNGSNSQDDVAAGGSKQASSLSRSGPKDTSDDAASDAVVEDIAEDPPQKPNFKLFSTRLEPHSAIQLDRMFDASYVEETTAALMAATDSLQGEIGTSEKGEGMADGSGVPCTGGYAGEKRQLSSHLPGFVSEAVLNHFHAPTEDDETTAAAPPLVAPAGSNDGAAENDAQRAMDERIWASLDDEQKQREKQRAAYLRAVYDGGMTDTIRGRLLLYRLREDCFAAMCYFLSQASAPIFIGAYLEFTDTTHVSYGGPMKLSYKESAPRSRRSASSTGAEDGEGNAKTDRAGGFRFAQLPPPPEDVRAIAQYMVTKGMTTAYSISNIDGDAPGANARHRMRKILLPRVYEQCDFTQFLQHRHQHHRGRTIAVATAAALGLPPPDDSGVTQVDSVTWKEEYLRQKQYYRQELQRRQAAELSEHGHVYSYAEDDFYDGDLIVYNCETYCWEHFEHVHARRRYQRLATRLAQGLPINGAADHCEGDAEEDEGKDKEVEDAAAAAARAAGSLAVSDLTHVDERAPWWAADARLDNVMASRLLCVGLDELLLSWSKWIVDNRFYEDRNDPGWLKRDPAAPGSPRALVQMGRYYIWSFRLNKQRFFYGVIPKFVKDRLRRQKALIKQKRERKAAAAAKAATATEASTASGAGRHELAKKKGKRGSTSTPASEKAERKPVRGKGAAGKAADPTLSSGGTSAEEVNSANALADHMPGSGNKKANTAASASFDALDDAGQQNTSVATTGEAAERPANAEHIAAVAPNANTDAANPARSSRHRMPEPQQPIPVTIRALDTIASTEKASTSPPSAAIVSSKRKERQEEPLQPITRPVTMPPSLSASQPAAPAHTTSAVRRHATALHYAYIDPCDYGDYPPPSHHGPQPTSRAYGIQTTAHLASSTYPRPTPMSPAASTMTTTSTSTNTRWTRTNAAAVPAPHDSTYYLHSGNTFLQENKKGEHNYYTGGLPHTPQQLIQEQYRQQQERHRHTHTHRHQGHTGSPQPTYPGGDALAYSHDSASRLSASLLYAHTAGVMGACLSPSRSSADFSAGAAAAAPGYPGVAGSTGNPGSSRASSVYRDGSLPQQTGGPYAGSPTGGTPATSVIRGEGNLNVTVVHGRRHRHGGLHPASAASNASSSAPRSPLLTAQSIPLLSCGADDSQRGSGGLHPSHVVSVPPTASGYTYPTTSPPWSAAHEASGNAPGGEWSDATAESPGGAMGARPVNTVGAGHRWNPYTSPSQ